MTVNTGKRPRIALIGPVLPFRGGIAQHTTRLHRQLATQAHLQTISFTRQYPLCLFPGQSDRDPQFTSHTDPDVQYVIDSLNPLTWRRAMQRIVQHHTTMVVMPWWTVYWTPCYRYLARRIRKAGIELVILCHNVLDHERATWKHILTRSVLQYASRFIVQSREGRRQLQVLFPHIPAEFLLLPIFDQYPQPRGALKRRASLELLFFGLIRPYKGLDLLLDAMAQLRGKDVFLSIVGEFWSSQQDTERQITRLRLSDHVELIPRYVTDEEAAEYFCRADVVVLPYRSATGSGVVSMAYHYEKPVIVTRVGGLADAVEHRRTGLVLPPDSSSEIASAIEAFREGSLPCFHRALQHLKTEMSWEHFARAIIDGSTTSARNRELAPGTVS